MIKPQLTMTKYMLYALFALIAGKTSAQQDANIRLNHLWIAVDSSTYEAISNSSFIQNEFAFSEERQYPGWGGFYIIGKNTYLELFHPESIEGESLEPGNNWSCYASMKSGHLDEILFDSSMVEIEDDDYFTNVNYVKYLPEDTLTPFYLFEMKQKQYESWVKKEYTPGMKYDPRDYNSRAESDSSVNYLFEDIIGVTYTIPKEDAPRIMEYFETKGYCLKKKGKSKVIMKNGIETHTLVLDNEIENIMVKRLDLKLSEKCKKTEYLIGKSKLVLDGNKAKWYFN